MKMHTFFVVSSIVLVACEGNQPPSPEPAQGTQPESVPSPQAKPVTEASGPDGFLTAFANEGRDAAWATSLESDLTRATSRFKGSKVQRIECKTTVCRLDFAFDSPLPMQTFGHDLDDAWRTAKLRNIGFRVSSDEDKRTATVYVTKEGYAPPASDGTPRAVVSQAPLR